MSESHFPGHIAPRPRISIQAFCESGEVNRMFEDSVSDRRMSKGHVKVHMGGVLAALEAYRGAPTPNLIVTETFANRDELLGHLESFAEYCDPGSKVMIIGHENDISLYREVMSRGESDYIVAPFTMAGFRGSKRKSRSCFRDSWRRSVFSSSRRRACGCSRIRRWRDGSRSGS